MKTNANLTRCQLLTYHFASVIGLAPFIVRNNKLHPAGFLRKAYPWVLTAATSLWIFVTLTHHGSEAIEATSINEFVFAIRVALYLGFMFSTQLSFAFRSGRMIEIVNRIIAIQKELANLGVEESHKKDRKIFYAKIIATNFAIFSMKMIVIFADKDHGHTTGAMVLMYTGSILLIIYSHNAILIFVEIVTCISELFESLNNKLEGNFRREHHVLAIPTGLKNQPITKIPGERIIVCQSVREMITDSVNVHLTPKDIEKLGKLHGELCELTKSTTNVFTAPIIFAILVHLSKLLTYSYLMYTSVVTVQISTKSIVRLVQKGAAQMAISVLQLLLIAKAGSSISRMGNATKVILHKLWNKHYPEELKNELLIFSLQLLHKPVAVSAFGFFNLDYSYLNKILYATLAYFIIMVQLDTTKPNTGV